MAQCDLAAAAALAELAGVSALRLSLNEELRPVGEVDVANLRRSARRFELRMPASQGLLKIALEARPDRVILASESRERLRASRPIDPRMDPGATTTIVRSLEEAGIAVTALVAPDLEAVKAVHGLGIRNVEFFTGAIVDLPEAERRAELERLGDAARIASKLRIGEIGLGGALDFHRTAEVLLAAPVANTVVAGRALVARAFLTGIDRAVRDFRELVAG